MSRGSRMGFFIFQDVAAWDHGKVFEPAVMRQYCRVLPQSLYLLYG